MNNKDITVLFLLYKTPFYLIKNLKPLKKFKILILDQSGDYILKKEIEKILPNIQYYGIKKRNRGFAKGINFLVKKVKTKYFLCIQPDVLVEEKSIFKLKQIIKKDKKSILAIPRIKGVKNFKFNHLSKKKTTNADTKKNSEMN